MQPSLPVCPPTFLFPFSVTWPGGSWGVGGDVPAAGGRQIRARRPTCPAAVPDGPRRRRSGVAAREGCSGWVSRQGLLLNSEEPPGGEGVGKWVRRQTRPQGVLAGGPWVWVWREAPSPLGERPQKARFFCIVSAGRIAICFCQTMQCIVCRVPGFLMQQGVW